MPKFFITEYELVPGGNAYIIGDDARHMKKSLRIKKDEFINVCDGKGNDFKARVENLENDAILLKITDKLPVNGEPALKVNLFLAVTKGEGFEYAIQNGWLQQHHDNRHMMCRCNPRKYPAFSGDEYS